MNRLAEDIFVISDLHLGDGGKRDNFEAGKKTAELQGFLDYVGGEGGELFVLGDLFELWQMNLSRTFIRRQELLDHFARLRLTFVPGNHDVDLADFAGTDFLKHPFFSNMRPPFVRELGGKRYRFFHGHETDPFNAGADPGFGRMLAIFAGVFEDENGSPLLTGGQKVEDLLEQFGDSMLTIWQTAMATMKRHVGQGGIHPSAALTPAQSPSRLGDHLASVRADLEKGDYDVAVLGHTHKAGRIGDWYFNSGSWTGPKNSFLRISGEGHVRYFEWENGCAVEREVPIVAAETKPEGASSPVGPFEAALSATRMLFPRAAKPERSRWILIAQGLLALSLGVATLTVSVGRGTTSGWRVLVTAFGVYALMDGVMSIVAASRETPLKRLLSRLRGVATLLLGLVVLRRGYAPEVFAVLFGFWAFLSGALRVSASLLLETLVDSRWLLIAGLGSMFAGLVVLLVPGSAPLVKYTLAACLCHYGLSELMAGAFGRRLPRMTRSFARPRRPVS